MYKKNQNYLDEKGNLLFKKEANPYILFPEISAREQFYLMWYSTDTSRCHDFKIIEHWRSILCGSRTTEWRTRKLLKERGIL